MDEEEECIEGKAEEKKKRRRRCWLDYGGERHQGKLVGWWSGRSLLTERKPEERGSMRGNWKIERRLKKGIAFNSEQLHLISFNF